MTIGLQDKYLKSLAEKQEHVIVYLKNGSKVKGQLKGISPEAVYISNGMLKSIYKHTVNRIMPIL